MSSIVKSKKVIDVVYIMNDKSKRANIELMFSLRSIKKHLKNYRTIHVFGADMSELLKKTTLIKHHVVPETEGNNQVQKHALIDVVCKSKDVSSDFILISDDCFLLEDQDANKMSFYYAGTLKERFDRYRNQQSVSLTGLKNTIKVLSKNNYNNKYYNTHTPLVINKADFLQLREDFHLDEFKQGLVYKSLYCNVYKKRGKSIVPAVLDSTVNDEGIAVKLNKATSFAVSDRGLTNNVIRLLNDKFPKKLTWEK